jgi:hypothetical protein
MDERKAAALLKQRFEAAGFTIAENVSLDEGDLSFEVDGFDANRRVGYEYVSRESGDGWDVDEDVIAALGKLHADGVLSILVIDEHDAPDEASLGRAADAFLAGLAKSSKAKPDAKPKAKAKGEPPPKPKAAAKPKAPTAPKKSEKDAKKPKKK